MSRKSIILLILLVVSPVAVYLLWPSDLARIKKLIRDSASAVETENLDNSMKYISFSYSDGYGMSYAMLGKILQRIFDEYSDIKIEFKIASLKISKESASAEIEVLVLASRGSERGYILGDLNESERITLALEKNPAGKWLINSISFASRGRLEPPVRGF